LFEGIGLRYNSTNTDGSSVSNSFISGAGLHGICLQGGDANCIITQNNIIHSCEGIGLYDFGFLGNTHIGNEVAECKQGSYVHRPGESGGDASTYINNYVEDDTPAPIIQNPGIWIGGIRRPDPELSTGLVLVSGEIANFRVQNYGDPTVTPGFSTFAAIALQGTSQTLSFGRTDHDGYGAAQLGHTFEDLWGWSWNNSPRKSVLGITDSYHKAGNFRLAMPLGFLLGTDKESIQLRYRRSNPPSASNRGDDPDNLWRQGDIVINTDSTKGQPIAWVSLRKGGWGGGTWSFDRRWKANTQYAIGDGVEPMIENGLVYRLKTIEISSVTGNYPGRGYNSAGFGFSGQSEPNPWPTLIGDVVQEEGIVTNPQYSIRYKLSWECWGQVDVDFSPVGTVGLKAAEVQPDSTSNDLESLRADFNALLAKLRNANMLEI
jgi:hypothetical protein